MSIPPVLEELKNKAKKQGLWNLWLSKGEFSGMAGGSGGGLTNLEVSVHAARGEIEATCIDPTSWSL
jgi:acyl-CoA dehydrogenase